eukprot:1136864-Pelagomonas_calceolata.AAC.3
MPTYAHAPHEVLLAQVSVRKHCSVIAGVPAVVRAHKRAHVQDFKPKRWHTGEFQQGRAQIFSVGQLPTLTCEGLVPAR